MRSKTGSLWGKRVIWFFATLSIVFMIAVHVAFSINAPVEWLAAKWTAGDILTYVSTVTLALLAVWQNNKMNEESEISQLRLEKLASQANELSVVSKILEIESDRLSRLKEAFDGFLTNCDIYILSKKMVFDVEVNPLTDDALSVKIQRQALKVAFINQIDDSLFFLTREIRNAHTVNDETKICAVSYYSLVRQLAIDMAEASNILTNDFQSRIDAAKKQRMDLMIKREEIIKKKEEALDRVLYENLSLQEIRVLFQKKNEKSEVNEEKSDTGKEEVRNE